MSGISGLTGTRKPRATRGRRRGRQQSPPNSDNGGSEDDFEEVGEPEKKRPRERPSRASSKSNGAPAKGNKAADRVKQMSALTGQCSFCPTLGMTQSEDVAFNVCYVIYSRMMTFKWKQLTWMPRAREAFQRSKKTWKRHPRWLVKMLSTDVAALWGHLGNMAKLLRGPVGPLLFW